MSALTRTPCRYGSLSQILACLQRYLRPSVNDTMPADSLHRSTTRRSQSASSTSRPLRVYLLLSTTQSSKNFPRHSRGRMPRPLVSGHLGLGHHGGMTTTATVTSLRTRQQVRISSQRMSSNSSASWRRRHWTRTFSLVMSITYVLKNIKRGFVSRSTRNLQSDTILSVRCFASTGSLPDLLLHLCTAQLPWVRHPHIDDVRRLALVHPRRDVA